jgi:hypothetical protein
MTAVRVTKRASELVDRLKQHRILVVREGELNRLIASLALTGNIPIL